MTTQYIARADETGFNVIPDDLPAWTPDQPYPPPEQCGAYVRYVGGAWVQWPDGTFGPRLLDWEIVPPADPAQWPQWVAANLPDYQ